jgi:flavin-dependent dehydrogenase
MGTICVIGGGPAGSTFAARMAQLGHDVVLVERATFPRRQLGESLSPGVLPLLGMTGARAAVEAAGFRRVRTVRIHWESGEEVRDDPREHGLIVGRGEFDRLLLGQALALGVRVLQPATVRAYRHDGGRWRVEAGTPGGTVHVEADFLADARGRAGGGGRTRRWTGVRTLALHAYWRGAALPGEPRIEAGGEAWYWGVPLPDGTYNTLAFVDARRFRAAGEGTLTARFLDLLGRSGLMAGCRDAAMIGPPAAIDATAYVDDACASAAAFKVGEAALALDPLSSSGVQKAIQGALSAAIVANTLLRRPERAEAALQFRRSSLDEASRRHRRWAAGHYAKVAERGGGPFWQSRAAGAQPEPLPPPTSPAARALATHALASAGVALSRQVEFVDLPCIDGDFVAVKPALRHPGLDGPLAYLGGREVALLLHRLPAGLTPLQIARSWSDRMPFDSAIAIAAWMLDRGLFVSHGRGPRESER